jgi:23S rRNA (adenine2503-C2)-methyltransferase
MQWLYVNKEPDFNKWTNLDITLRQKLEAGFLARTLQIIKKEESIIDGSIRYTFKTIDKKIMYAVLLRNKSDYTVCLSSQIGCPAACVFCNSGRVKFVRNLTSGEIIEQVLQIENDLDKRVGGILFMAMGEPMLNFNNVVAAVKSFISKREFNIGKRHITLSTVGYASAIKQLAAQDAGVRLAVSLHAVDDKQRRKIIPAAAHNSIDDILRAAQNYIKQTKARLTIEYILIDDFNSSAQDAHKLVRLLRKYGLHNKSVQVNLIPFNEIPKVNFRPPGNIAIDKFKAILSVSGVITNIRQAKGADIGAACGQLG